MPTITNTTNNAAKPTQNVQTPQNVQPQMRNIFSAKTHANHNIDVNMTPVISNVSQKTNTKEKQECDVCHIC